MFLSTESYKFTFFFFVFACNELIIQQRVNWIFDISPSDYIQDSGGDFYEDYYDYDVDDFTISPISALLGSGTPRPSTTTKPSSAIITTPSSLASTVASASVTTPLVTDAGPTQATGESSPPSSSLSPKPLHHQNVIIMNEDPIAMPAPQPMPQLQADEIPVQVIMEPLLKPRIRPAAMNRLVNHRSAPVHEKSDDSKVVRMRSRNAVTTHCQHGQSRDRNGRCRNRRSGL